MGKSTMRMSLLPALAALMLGGGAAAAAAPDAQEFVTKAALAGMTEVETAKVAQAKSADSEVKNFAARMIADHEKANKELAAIAKAKGLTVPARLDAEHTQVVQKLNSKSGAEFDAAYSGHMAMDHAKAVSLFEANADVPDARLAAFATKTLPVLREHKRLADALKADQTK